MNIIITIKLSKSLAKLPKVIRGYPNGAGNRMIRCDLLHDAYILATDELSLYSKIIKLENGGNYTQFALSVMGLFDDKNGLALNCYSYQNRHVSGSMNDMHRLIDGVIDSGSGYQEAEDLINKTPFKLLGMKRPKDVYCRLL